MYEGYYAYMLRRTKEENMKEKMKKMKNIILTMDIKKLLKVFMKWKLLMTLPKQNAKN